jgi:hypothetical protein
VIVTNEYGCISDSSNHVYFTNVSVSELSYDEYFIIYPNPTTNQINFTLPNNEDYEIVIFNALSSNVTSSGVEKAFGNGICTINISYLPPGIYFIEVRGDKILRGRFVKE